MANRGMGRGSQRRTVIGLRMDALLSRQAAADRAAASGVATGAEALARIELLCAAGRIDAQPNGERRAYPVTVAGEAGRAYVSSLGDCLLVAFLVPGKAMRRLLVVPGAGGVPECWLQRREDLAAVFPHAGKYSRAAVTLIARRAHETDRVARAA